MSKRVRKSVVGLAAAGALLIVSPTALATTVSPTGSITGTGTTADWTDTTSGVGFSCTGASLVDDLSADGTGTIAPGAATFTGCTSILGSRDVTQPAAWSSAVSYNGGHPTLTLNVPGTDAHDSALKFELAGGGCTFWLAGSVTSDVASSPILSDITFTGATGLRVTAVDPDNDCFGFYMIGDAILFDAHYNLDHLITVGP